MCAGWGVGMGVWGVGVGVCVSYGGVWMHGVVSAVWRLSCMNFVRDQCERISSCKHAKGDAICACFLSVSGFPMSIVHATVIFPNASNGQCN